MRRRLVGSVLLLVAVLSTACGLGGTDNQSGSTAPTISPPGADDESARLAAARARWAESGIDSYRWTFTRRCFCEPWKTRVHVEQGEPVGRVVTSGRPSELDFITMEEFFAVIQTEIARSDSVTVTYDPATGRVLTADFDRFTNGADDELGYTVDKFRELGGSS